MLVRNCDRSPCGAAGDIRRVKFNFRRLHSGGDPIVQHDTVMLAIDVAASELSSSSRALIHEA
jgi:hypothetical protein